MSAAETMRASVLVAPETLELRDVPAPRAGPADLLLRPAAVGLCGTDFHIYSGDANYHRDERGRPVPLERHPQILGHEVAAVVEAVGEAVDGFAPGDRVVVDQGLCCHSTGRALCEYCASGDSHQCESYAEHGITGLPGGLAERLALPARNAVRIDGELRLEQAALCEPLACVLHALDGVERATTRYRLTGDDASTRAGSVVIAGAGPAGLLFTQVLRAHLGFQGVLIVLEPDAGKRARAERFGARALDPHDADVVEAVSAATAGRMAEVFVDASGAGPVYEAIPALTRKQATLLLYGYGHAGTGLEVLNGIRFREPHVVMTTGASGGFGEATGPLVYARALDLIRTGVVDVGSLVTHRYEGLESLPQAFGGDHHQTGYVKGVALL